MKNCTVSGKTIGQSSLFSSKSAVVDFVFWDVGGCDKIRPLWRHYFQNTTGILFFVDSTDSCRIQQAGDELFRILEEDELQDSVLCIIANKQDLVETAMPISRIAEKLDLKRLAKSRRWTIKAVSSIEGTGMAETMDWLYNACSEVKKDEMKGKNNAKKDSGEKDDGNRLETILLEWLEREDDSDDEFLSKLDSFTLETWDHRTHLRIAWLLLSRHGRQKGLPMVFDKIQNFIEHSPRTVRLRGTTFHVTMTYFWAHMVHYAMVTTTMKVSKRQNVNKEVYENDDNVMDNEIDNSKNFRTFLLLNPQLANGGLFLHYYSKKLMLQTSASRTEFVLPDLHPLPTLLTDVTRPISGGGDEKHSSCGDSTGATNVTNDSKPGPLPRRAAPLSDDEFLLRWEATISAREEGSQKQQLTYWNGHESRIRIIWLCLQRYGRNKKGTDKIFDGLRSMEGPKNHSITLTYYWLHMIDFYSQKGLLQEKSNSGSTKGEIITFGMFIQKQTSQPLRNPDLVSKYYSQKQLDKGREEFVLPDLKPLPSILSK